ncbi:MAG: lytic transglycosylase domain-containing protein [Solirubrobacterales bacterium]
MKGSAPGQAGLLMVAMLMALATGSLGLGMLARGLGARADRQQAADLAALAGARALHESAMAPAPGDPRVRAGQVARETARRNGALRTAVSFEGDGLPGRVRVTVTDPIRVPGGGSVASRVSAEAQLAFAPAAPVGDGEYRGPLAVRQGKPMRPDTALAFDRMNAAARREGVALVIASGWRSNAEQARLFAAHPDPKWVAPPGRSLHRLGTELDLGPPAAYGWLARNARRFGFVQRYSWEPWHYGLVSNAGSRSVGFAPAGGGLPAFVPARYAPAIRRASVRWSVGAAILAAQLKAESDFNPRVVSPVGARGIAQFMPGTARTYGLRDPFDPEASIDAQAHFMHDLLRRFGSVPLALAAYNAGPGRVAACGCIPPIPETQAYVAKILALAAGAADGPVVRLVG